MKSNKRIKLSEGGATSNPNIDGQRLLRVAVGGGAGGLLGAVLGAGGGLLHEAFLESPEKAQYLRRMLQGAGIGGLAGLGLGAGFGNTQTAANLHHDLNNLLEDAANNFNRNLSNVSVEINHPLGTSTASLRVNQKPKRPESENA
jgi:hypothetical protein